MKVYELINHSTSITECSS